MFHGRTGYTMSLTDSPDKRKTMYFPKFDWPRVTNPKITFPLEENLEHIVELESKAIAEIKDAINANPDDIASSATRKPVLPEAPVMANFIGIKFL